MYAGLHVNCMLFCPILTKLDFLRGLINSLNIKFHDSSCSGSRDILFVGRADEQSNMTELLVTFAPNKCCVMVASRKAPTETNTVIVFYAVSRRTPGEVGYDPFYIYLNLRFIIVVSFLTYS